MGVPTGFALHALALQRAVPAENVLERPRHHVVDAGLAIGRGGALKEDEAAFGRA